MVLRGVLAAVVGVGLGYRGRDLGRLAGRLNWLRTSAGVVWDGMVVGLSLDRR